VSDNFCQANYRDFAGVNQKFASGGAHLVSAHAKKSGTRRQLVQGLNELGAVVVAGGFTGGKQKVHHFDRRFWTGD
jgi:hypothetical protein